MVLSSDDDYVVVVVVVGVFSCELPCCGLY